MHSFSNQQQGSRKVRVNLWLASSTRRVRVRVESESKKFFSRVEAESKICDFLTKIEHWLRNKKIQTSNLEKKLNMLWTLLNFFLKATLGLYGIAKNRVVPPVFTDQYRRRYLATCLNIKFLWIFKESAHEPHVLREFLNFQLASQLQLASWYGLASSTREFDSRVGRTRESSPSRVRVENFRLLVNPAS